MKKISPQKTIYACLVLIPLLAGTMASGAPLVYEGFNYGISDNVELNGVAVTGTGLSGNWTRAESVSSSGSYKAHYRSSGLTFSNLATSGGSLDLAIEPGSGGEEILTLGAAIGAGSGTTGTIYQSYLVERKGTLSLGGDQMVLRLIDDIDSGSNSSNDPRLATAVDSIGNLDGIGVAYDNGFSSSSSTLAIDTTYLIVAKWTNVGLAGGGTGSMWALNESAYDTWQTNGGLEGGLDTYATYGLTDSDLAQENFDNFLQFFIREGGANATGTIEATYDEVRFGTTLGDVIMIPEPGTGALVFLGLLVCVALRRKKF